MSSRKKTKDEMIGYLKKSKAYQRISNGFNFSTFAFFQNIFFFKPTTFCFEEVKNEQKYLLYGKKYKSSKHEKIGMLFRACLILPISALLFFLPIAFICLLFLNNSIFFFLISILFIISFVVLLHEMLHIAIIKHYGLPFKLTMLVYFFVPQSVHIKIEEIHSLKQYLNISLFPYPIIFLFAYYLVITGNELLFVCGIYIIIWHVVNIFGELKDLKKVKNAFKNPSSC